MEAASVSKVQQAILDRRLAELDKDVERLLSTAAERRTALIKRMGEKYGPTVVGAVLKTLT